MATDRSHVLVAVAAAERAFALVELWGRPKDVAKARAILNDIWTATEAASAKAAMELAARVEALPDAQVHDPELPHQTALEALSEAAAAIGGQDRAAQVMTPDLFSEIDYWASLRAGGPRTRIIDPRNPPAAGPYQILEAERVLRDRHDAMSLAPHEAREVLRTRAAAERADLLAPLRPLVEFSRDIRER
jgi:hypothetical protein